MHVSSLSRTIFIVDGDPGLSQSTRTLLETRDYEVHTIPHAEAFDRTAASHQSDVVLLDLDHKRPGSYKLLNDLMLSPIKSAIILITDPTSTLRPDDIFPGKRVKILMHPVVPAELVSAINASA